MLVTRRIGPARSFWGSYAPIQTARYRLRDFKTLEYLNVRKKNHTGLASDCTGGPPQSIRVDVLRWASRSSTSLLRRCRIRAPIWKGPVALPRAGPPALPRAGLRAFLRADPPAFHQAHLRAFLRADPPAFHQAHLRAHLPAFPLAGLMAILPAFPRAGLQGFLRADPLAFPRAGPPAFPRAGLQAFPRADPLAFPRADPPAFPRAGRQAFPRAGLPAFPRGAPLACLPVRLTGAEPATVDRERQSQPIRSCSASRGTKRQRS